MENYLICKCKKVTYADVEDALHNELLKALKNLLKMFRRSRIVPPAAEAVTIK